MSCTVKFVMKIRGEGQEEIINTYKQKKVTKWNNDKRGIKQFRALKYNDENEIFTVGFQHQIFHSTKMGTGTMIQHLTMLVTQPFSLNSISRTNMVEGEDQISQVSF